MPADTMLDVNDNHGSAIEGDADITVTGGSDPSNILGPIVALEDDSALHMDAAAVGLKHTVHELMTRLLAQKGRTADFYGLEPGELLEDLWSKVQSNQSAAWDQRASFLTVDVPTLAIAVDGYLNDLEAKMEEAVNESSHLPADLQRGFRKQIFGLFVRGASSAASVAANAGKLLKEFLQSGAIG